MTTRWHLDTCACILLVEADGGITAEALCPVHTQSTVAEIVAEHQAANRARAGAEE